MSNLVVRGQIREIDDREIDSVCLPVSAAYDDLRDALHAGSRQKVERALADVAEIDLAMAEHFSEKARQPATKREIAFHTTKLLGVMPHFTGGAFDMDAFMEQLVADLVEEKPGLMAIVAGFRKVRQTSQTFPTIAQILEAVRAVDSNYRSIATRLERLPERITEAEAFLLRST